MLKKRTWTLALFSAALTVTLATSGFVMGKGKPPKPDPEPDPPAIEYHLTWLPTQFGELHSIKMNNSGDIVGDYYIGGDSSILADARAFLYTSSNDLIADLNTLIPPESGLQVRITAGNNDPGHRINDLGQIAGYGYVEGDAGKHAFIYTPANGNTPATIEDLSLHAADHVTSRATALNNNGDVCLDVRRTDEQHYDYVWWAPNGPFDELGTSTQDRIEYWAINDSGSVVVRNNTTSTHSIYSPINGMTYYYDDLGNPAMVYDINKSGQFICAADVPPEKGKKYVRRVCRYTDGIGFESLGFSGVPVSINNGGDCVANPSSGDGHLFLSQSGDVLNIRDVVTQGDSADLAEWALSSKIRIEDINDNQSICGHAQFTDETGHISRKAFLLTKE